MSGTWKLKQRLLKKDGPVCRYCGRTVDPADTHLDHIVPKSRGGSGRTSNFAMACTWCNMLKMDHMLEEFAERIPQVLADAHAKLEWAEGLYSRKEAEQWPSV